VLKFKPPQSDKPLRDYIAKQTSTLEEKEKEFKTYVAVSAATMEQKEREWWQRYTKQSEQFSADLRHITEHCKDELREIASNFREEMQLLRNSLTAAMRDVVMSSGWVSRRPRSKEDGG
jgi:hypothetical protein